MCFVVVDCDLYFDVGGRGGATGGATVKERQ